MKKFTLFGIVLCGMLAFGSDAIAAAKTRMEVAVERHQQQVQYVPVANLWEADPTYSSANATAHVRKSQGLVANRAVQHALLTQKPAGITLSVTDADGKQYELELMSYEFFSEGFKVTTNSNGVSTDFAYNKGAYYRGVIKNVPGSIASFTVFSDAMYGIFSIPNVGNFVIAPNTLQSPRVEGHYVVFNDKDDVEPIIGNVCGTDNQTMGSKTTKEGTGAKNVYNTCKDVEEFIKVDYDTYMDYGGNPAAVTQITNYMTALYNMIATCYRNEGIYTSIRQIEVNTSVDAYSGINNRTSRNYLFMMDDEFNGNLKGADLCMLITNVPAGMGGVAWLNALCAPASSGTDYGPYSFSNIRNRSSSFTGTVLPRYHWDIQVITHEMGHNLGSPHTHDCVWGPNGTTSIDWCAPTYDISLDLDGCGVPVPNPTPAVGGTIMSYCHLLNGSGGNPNIGINLANGFGPEPGQRIRDFVDNSSCATPYIVSVPQTTAGVTLTANRECTDNGITYYWEDNNDAVESNDKLVLAIGKNGNDIGNLDDQPSTFQVQSLTGLSYGAGNGLTVSMPVGIVGIDKAVASYRYWKMVAKQPNTDVTVMFPFLRTDMADIQGGISGRSIAKEDLGMYVSKSALVDVDPSTGLASATAADLIIYSANPAASTMTVSTNADTFMANVTTRSLYGGAVYAVNTFPAAVAEVGQEQIAFYPNPTNSEWSVYIPLTAGKTAISLYSADGKLVTKQSLEAGIVNKVGAAQLAAGMYFYRVSSESSTYTGTLKKQ